MIRPTSSSAGASSSLHQVVPTQVEPSKERLSSNAPPTTAPNYQAHGNNHQGINVFIESIYKILNPVYQLAKNHSIEPKCELKNLGDQINFGVTALTQLTLKISDLSNNLFHAVYGINQLLHRAFSNIEIINDVVVPASIPTKIDLLQKEIERLQGIETQHQALLQQHQQTLSTQTDLEQQNLFWAQTVVELQNRLQALEAPQPSTIPINMSHEEFKACLAQLH